MTTTYTWDEENRLKATEGGGTITVYDYDYSGIRVSQTVNGVETLTFPVKYEIEPEASLGKGRVN